MIALRKVRLTHTELLFEWMSDPMFKKFSMGSLDFTPVLADIAYDILKSRMATALDDYTLVYDDDVPVGYIHVRWDKNVPDSCGGFHHTCWFSYTIAPAYRGRGLAKQSLLCCIDKLTKIGCKEMYAGVFKENYVSQHILESIGFIKIPSWFDHSYCYQYTMQK